MKKKIPLLIVAIILALTGSQILKLPLSLESWLGVFYLVSAGALIFAANLPEENIQ